MVVSVGAFTDSPGRPVIGIAARIAACAHVVSQTPVREVHAFLDDQGEIPGADFEKLALDGELVDSREA